MRTAWAGLLTLAGTTIAAAALALDGYRSGFRYGGDTPAFVLSLAAATLACGTAAFLVSRHERYLSRWLAATTGTLWLYLAASATAVQYAGLGGRRDALARVAVLLHATGHILPIVLLEICFVVAIQRLAGRGSIRAGVVLLVYSVGYQVFEAMTRPNTRNLELDRLVCWCA